MDILYLCQFCDRDLFVKNADAPCYARPIHVNGALSSAETKPTRAILSHTRPGGKKVVERV